MATTETTETRDKNGPRYFIEVDGQEYRLEQETITGGEIMDLAGIPRDVGLVLLQDDGTQEQVGADEVIELKPGRRFKKAAALPAGLAIARAATAGTRARRPTLRQARAPR
jgi:hypothetical protein